MDNRFDGVLYGICENLRRYIEMLPEGVKKRTEEIRLRVGAPVSITIGGRPKFILKNGEISDYINGSLVIADKNDLSESFILLCRHSVYAHAPELKNGYISMTSGHRAGVCGAFNENGVLHDITSINIRIAREIFGAADELLKVYRGGGFLIAGPPGSGKTTILRDFVRQLSSGICGDYRRVAVIDSRGEIAGGGDGGINNLGGNTDILKIADKSVGIEIAVRTLFPDVVAFDEIGTEAELAEVSESFNAGVEILTTAHIGSESDLMRRSVTSGLLRSGAIEQIAVLSPILGEKPKLISCTELLYEYDA